MLAPYNDTQAAFAASLEEVLRKAEVQGDLRRGQGEIVTGSGTFVQTMPPKFWNPQRRNTIVFLFHKRGSSLRVRLAFTLEAADRWTPTLGVSYLMTCSDGPKELLVEQDADKPLPAVENAIQQFVVNPLLCQNA